MYPIVSWERSKVIGRIERLVSQGFQYEAVIASAQTIEQIFKRCIKYKMNTTRKMIKLEMGKFKKKLVTIENSKDRNKCLRHLSDITDLKSAWNLYFEKESNLHINDIICSYYPNGWALLVTDKQPKGKSIKTSFKGEPIKLHFGLFGLRHHLIHSTHGIKEADVPFLAEFGVRIVTSLLDSEVGLESKLGWSPQNRIPRLTKLKQ